MGPLLDLAQTTIASGVSPTTAVTAVAGVGTVWFTRFMVTRMIRQYDAGQECHKKQIDELRVKVAVLEARAADRRDAELAVQVQLGSAVSKVEKLGNDVGVAHRRIEALARGDTAIIDIKSPERKDTP